ncbi:putative acetyltransferase EpsM [Phycisphaerae bacterium RAS1]|nr:putative acetyltransferase EpsM [Phycisphaerae bacterium RAS1]
MIDLVIFGAGGLGQMVFDILHAARGIHVVGFLDSDRSLHGSTVGAVRVIGGLESIDTLRRRGVSHAVVAIGDNPTRVEIADAIRARRLELASAVHPAASISIHAEIGAHVIIGPRATLCVHARVAEHAVIGAGCIVEHEGSVGRGSFLHPAVRLAGAVTVEAYVTLGIGCTVIPGRRIAAGARVEPGSIVIRDVSTGGHVGGIPAAPLPAPASRFRAAAEVGGRVSTGVFRR